MRRPPNREVARQFWRVEVISKSRKDWQKQQWAEAIRWYLQWLDVCNQQGKSAISLAERVRNAVDDTGSRRGLAMRTKETYGSWAARFAQWAGSRERVMNQVCAKEWLTMLVSLYARAY